MIVRMNFLKPLSFVFICVFSFLMASCIDDDGDSPKTRPGAPSPSQILEETLDSLDLDEPDSVKDSLIAAPGEEGAAEDK